MQQFSPLVEELRPVPQPEAALVAFSSLPHCLFLDSAMQHPKLGRFSFLAADPFDYFEVPPDGMTLVCWVFPTSR